MQSAGYLGTFYIDLELSPVSDGTGLAYLTGSFLNSAHTVCTLDEDGVQFTRECIVGSGFSDLVFTGPSVGPSERRAREKGRDGGGRASVISEAEGGERICLSASASASAW